MKKILNLKTVKWVTIVCLLFIMCIPIMQISAANAKKIKLNKKTLTLYVGEKKTIKAKTKGKVKWKSSDKKIATVNKKGVVRAKKAGSAKITVTSVQNKKIKAICRVNVKEVNDNDNDASDKVSNDNNEVEQNPVSTALPEPGGIIMIADLTIESITPKTDNISTVRLKVNRSPLPFIGDNIKYVEIEVYNTNLEGFLIGDSVRTLVDVRNDTLERDGEICRIITSTPRYLTK